MTGAVTLITDFLYSSTTVVIIAALVALLFALLWFAWPIKRLLDSTLAQRARQLERAGAAEGALEPDQQRGRARAAARSRAIRRSLVASTTRPGRR